MARLPSFVLLLALSPCAASPPHAEELALLQVRGDDAPADAPAKTKTSADVDDLDRQGVEMTHYTTGARVRITGLQEAPEINGQEALVRGWDASAARWKVSLVPSGLGKLVKADNVEPLAAEVQAKPVKGVIQIAGHDVPYVADSHMGNSGTVATMADALKMTQAKAESERAVNEQMYDVVMARKRNEAPQAKLAKINPAKGDKDKAEKEKALLGEDVAEEKEKQEPVAPQMRLGKDSEKRNFDSVPRQQEPVLNHPPEAHAAEKAPDAAQMQRQHSLVVDGAETYEPLN